MAVGLPIGTFFERGPASQAIKNELNRAGLLAHVRIHVELSENSEKRATFPNFYDFFSSC